MRLSIAVLALLAASPALAADPGPFGTLTGNIQNVFSDAPYQSRTGLVPYIGLNAGLSMADTELSVPGASFDGIGSKGITGGFNLGIDYVTTSKVFAGLWASYNFQDTNTELKVGPNHFKVEMGDSYALGGRLGYDWGRARLYALAGYRHTDLDWPTGVVGVPRDLTGLDLGVGAGYSIAKNVELDLKIVHTGYQDEKVGSVKMSTEQLQGLASVNFRF